MTRAIPVLPSRDILESLAFYQDHLGFGESFVHGEPVNYGRLSKDGVELHFFYSENPDVPAWTSFRLGVRDIEELYELCRQRGIVHPNAPLETHFRGDSRVEKPWGSREFAVVDSSGVLVVIWEDRS